MHFGTRMYITDEVLTVTVYKLFFGFIIIMKAFDSKQVRIMTAIPLYAHHQSPVSLVRTTYPSFPFFSSCLILVNLILLYWYETQVSGLKIRNENPCSTIINAIAALSLSLPREYKMRVPYCSLEFLSPTDYYMTR
jgi:hypothetical protein